MVEELDYRNNQLDNLRHILYSENPSPAMEKLRENVQRMIAKNDPRRENIVATFNLKCKLDLKAIASRLMNVLYDPESFNGLIIRLDTMSTVILSASGKAAVTGAKTEFEARRIASSIASILETSMGYDVEILNDFKVEGVPVAVKESEQKVYTIKDGALVEVKKPRIQKGGKRDGVCVPGIPKCVKRMLVTLGLSKSS